MVMWGYSSFLTQYKLCMFRLVNGICLVKQIINKWSCYSGLGAYDMSVVRDETGEIIGNYLGYF